MYIRQVSIKRFCQVVRILVLLKLKRNSLWMRRRMFSLLSSIKSCKNSVFSSSEKWKRVFYKNIWEEKVAECSVCQFVKSNCLIGFNSRRMGPHGWFVAKPGNSKWIFHKKSVWILSNHTLSQSYQNLRAPLHGL